MGDRISISFIRGKEKSVVLFSHWDGESFKTAAEDYVRRLKLEIDAPSSPLRGGPLGRLEPNTVMVDFIRDFTEGKGRVDGNYYLGATEDDGDDSDNGHYEISLD